MHLKAKLQQVAEQDLGTSDEVRAVFEENPAVVSEKAVPCLEVKAGVLVPSRPCGGGCTVIARNQGRAVAAA